jgi:hypothetical protein
VKENKRSMEITLVLKPSTIKWLMAIDKQSSGSHMLAAWLLNINSSTGNRKFPRAHMGHGGI